MANEERFKLNGIRCVRDPALLVADLLSAGVLKAADVQDIVADTRRLIPIVRARLKELLSAGHVDPAEIDIRRLERDEDYVLATALGRARARESEPKAGDE